jgi:ribosomal protein S18 acetylase RimI-like enzyme
MGDILLARIGEFDTDSWFRATSSWSELCLAMGCTRVIFPGSSGHFYDVNATGTFYNFVHVQEPSTCPIETIQAEFARRGLPFAVRIPRRESYLGFVESLYSKNFLLVPVWIMMRHENEFGERSPKVVVAEIDRSHLSEWIGTSNIPDLPDIHRVTQREMISRAFLTKSIRLLLATYDNKPAGTALLFLKDRIGSIHFVATRPEFRRKRVATTVVLEAINRLEDEGVDFVWLRTRKGGIGEQVYLQIGFKPFADILTYSKTPDLDSQSVMARL